MKKQQQHARKMLSSSCVAAVATTLVLSLVSPSQSFLMPQPTATAAAAPTNTAQYQRQSSLLHAVPKKTYSEDELKAQLTEYLTKRKEANADEEAQKVKGKVVGGTRGNAVLEFVSGAPVKEQIIEKVPDVFDYDQLSKYGYGKLVEPIMGLEGGRRAVYDLMGMEAPPLVGPPPKKKVPKLKIDRTGEEDKARYTGLKMGQVLDDDVMGEALARANQAAKEGKTLRAKLMEEEYVQPFADKRNTGPAQTPDWTPEKLDEFAKQQGRAQSWARASKLGRFVKDPYESSSLPAETQLYAVATAFFVAFAFGRATPKFLTDLLHIGTTSSAQSLQEVLQIPGLALAVASLGSGLVCAVALAPGKNRSSLLWGIKGFLGGPPTVLQLRSLDTLITFGEQEEAKAAAEYEAIKAK